MARRPVLVAIVALAIALGAFFRCYHLGTKVFWEDETYTALHVLGLTEADIVRRAPAITDAAALRAVLHPPPPIRSSAVDTVRALASEDPQHPPAYYVLGHWWIGRAGDSVVALRALSAAIGLLALPCMYWLCDELFASRLAAWCGVALLATSPIAVLFSQEAREYELWCLALIVMTALLLRALRTRGIAGWIGYAIATAFALYVFPLTAIVALANCALALGLARDARTRIAACTATGAAFIAYAPWLAVLVGSRRHIAHAIGAGMMPASTKIAVLATYGALAKLDFLDFDLGRAHHALSLGLSVAVIALLVAAVRVFARSGASRAGPTIGVLLVSAVVPFALADLVAAQHLGENPRYFIPLYLGVELLLAGAFAAALRSRIAWQRDVWTAIFALVIVGRIASDAASAQATTWWTKFNERSIDVAHAIDAAPAPLLVSEEELERPLSLADHLDPRVAVRLNPHCYLCTLPPPKPYDAASLRAVARGRNVFVLGPSATLAHQLPRALGREHARYACIGDALEAASACGDGPLSLWPR